MRKDTMTARERWLAVLTGEKPDRVPMAYRATQEATDRLLRHLGYSDAQDLYARLHIDHVVGVAPSYVGPPLPADQDVFGCTYRTVDYGLGVYAECVHSPLAAYGSVDEIERSYQWPSPDWWDYSHIGAQVAAHPDCPIHGGGSEPFLTYKRLRGEELGTMDLVLNPDIVHYCLDRLFGLAYEQTSRIYEQARGQVMITGVAEDMGSQVSLLFGLEHIRTYLLPRMKRMMDLAHQAGAYVMHHSDGAVRPVIPDLIDLGIDILDPVQWRCTGMEREGLKRDFGDRLVFHGAMDNQYTLARGTVDEVRAEVADNLRILGRGGGYILAPCHNIQSVSSPESIVAMYETGYELGWS